MMRSTLTMMKRLREIIVKNELIELNVNPNRSIRRSIRRFIQMITTDIKSGTKKNQSK